MTKEEQLIEAFLEAITTPYEEKVEEYVKRVVDIAKDMTVGDVKKCQQEAIDIIHARECASMNTTIH